MGISSERLQPYLPAAVVLYLLNIKNYSKQKKKMDFKLLERSVDKIRNNIASLDISERQQWQSTMFNKVNILYRHYDRAYQATEIQFAETLGRQIRALRQGLYTLVFICVIQQIQYDSARIQAMIKQFYYKEYGEEVLPYLEAAHYSTTTLVYRTSRVPYHCCKEKLQKDLDILD